MDKDRVPTAAQYRESAEEIRRAAEHSRSEAIRRELLELAARYERLAEHVEHKRVPR
jgi:hypothetical protein